MNDTPEQGCTTSVVEALLPRGGVLGVHRLGEALAHRLVDERLQLLHALTRQRLLLLSELLLLPAEGLLLAAQRLLLPAQRLVAVEASRRVI